MSNIIKIGNLTIDSFKVGSDDCQVYLGTTKLYPHLQTPCFAVVNDISQYSDREFEDVFNLADEKWYVLNNLNQYEEYGIYGSGRTITYYEGKLTIDGDYEYQYSGGSWVNVGEISESTNAYRYWMWRSVGEIVGTPSNFIQFSEFDLAVNGSDVSLSYISAAPYGVTTGGTIETADKLFDNDTSTKYCADFSSYLNTNYILFDAQSAITPTAFAMTTANDNSQFGRYPTSWVLLGSNTSTTNWNDGSWNLVLSGTCGNEMYADYTRFEYPIIYDYSQVYLTLEALESGTIGFSAGTVDYSTDSGSTWNTLAQGNTISVNQGDNVMFKMSGATPNENTGIGTFTSSCRFNVYGNIMSMQEGDNFTTAIKINSASQFKRLFAQSKVVNAENMVLPATTLQNFCYNEIFKDATYLTTPPKIFPATGLTQDCYSFAFDGCTSLTKSPMLPALTSARASYGWMFQDSTSLSEVTCLATDVSAQYATYDWLNNVASSGTFYKNPNASWSRGTSGIPSNWNVEDYVEPTPSVYPVYYDEMQDPPNYLSFSSMTEALSYECPWVGMKATIAGSAYTFNSNYEWEYIPSRLPVGYTELQYIENADFACIRIDYHANQDTRIVTTMQAVQTNENPYGRFFGSGHWNCEDGNHGYQFDYEEYPTGQLHISWGAECGWNTYDVYGDYSAHTYDLNKNEFYIDNTLVASTAYQNFTCENKLGIFAAIFGNDRAPNTYPDESKEYLRGILYDFKVYDDGVLAVDLVPCTNPDSVVGMYDIVNDVFYTSVNSGYYFVAGPPVTPPTPPKVYLTYIDQLPKEVECNGDPVLRYTDFSESQVMDNIATATIGNCVTELDYRLFYYASISAVTISDTVTTIGNSAFEYCGSLTSVNIPNSVTSIGNSAFGNCGSLSSCTLGTGVTSIGDFAFQGCSSLTSIDIPSGITTINGYTFKWCSSLTGVTIPATVTSIGEETFRLCTSLPSVTIPDSVTIIGKGAFDSCSGLTSVTLGSGVTTIDTGAFYGCSGLTSIIIPTGVTTIGYNVFNECVGLANVTCLATTPPSLRSGAFDNTSSNLVIYVPAESVSTYLSASGWSSLSSRIQAIP